MCAWSSANLHASDITHGACDTVLRYGDGAVLYSPLGIALPRLRGLHIPPLMAVHGGRGVSRRYVSIQHRSGEYLRIS